MIETEEQEPEAEIYDTNSFDFVKPNKEFVDELCKNDIDYQVKIDPDGYCRRIFKSDELEVIKHTCGCVSDDKRTLSFARKMGSRIGQATIARLAKLKENCK